MTGTPFLEVQDLTVVFPGTRRLLRRPTGIHAVAGVDLTVGRHETLGLVGESGSGKSTLGRAILGLQVPTDGSIRVGGTAVAPLIRDRDPVLRRRIQAVFQDPFGSLNPTKTIAQSLAAPLRRHGTLPKSELDARIDELLGQVGLAPYGKNRYPYEFSGGQRQRIAIARALSVDPSLIVLDEAVSALDVSVQSQIIGLLEHLQEDLGVAYLFIAHDLAVVRHVSHRIAVMYRGHIVEQGETERVCSQPVHPYTRLLLAAAPEPDPTSREERRARRRTLGGLESTGGESQSGCVFANRCPQATDVCRETAPTWTQVGSGGAACHLLNATGTPLPMASPNPDSDVRSERSSAHEQEGIRTR